MYMGSSHVTESVVSQILTELDGLEELKNVVVLAATNRPDMIDPALMRPGRLDRVIYVPPPDAESRIKIFEVYLRNAEAILAGDLKIADLVAKTEGYVGADIEALVREAKLGAMREFITAMAGKSEQERKDAAVNIRITKNHFEEALGRVKGSLDADTLEEHERRSWEMIFNAEQRKLLEAAVSAIKRADLASLGSEGGDDLAEAMEDLRRKTFARKKDFGAVKKGTAALEKILGKKEKNFEMTQMLTAR
jgi:transitional endoplasmic reticulum ATPase